MENIPYAENYTQGYNNRNDHTTSERKPASTCPYSFYFGFRVPQNLQ